MLTVAKLRDLEQQVNRGEISYSRMVELINEIVGTTNSVAEQIVMDLANWSEKYPRTQIYGMSRKDEMDGELIKLEDRAKYFKHRTNG